jgi:hypothetical protein
VLGNVAADDAGEVRMIWEGGALVGHLPAGDGCEVRS